MRNPKEQLYRAIVWLSILFITYMIWKHIIKFIIKVWS